MKNFTATLLAGFVISAATVADEPGQTDYSDSVKVEIVQLEVTAWPDSGDAGECAVLTADDFALTVNGRHRDLYAVDRVGTVATTARGVSAGDETVSGNDNPLTLVLFFDLWHLNMFSRVFTCPATKPLAFERAREMVRSSFEPGDRLLVVTFAGWPMVHQGWIRDPDEALAALDRLEVSPQALSPRGEHADDRPLVDGLGSLLLALGRYPGRKDLLFLSDDFSLEAIGTGFLEIAADAQANGVTLNAVDMLDSCRRVPGPGCIDRGGLACTPWREPAGIGYLATHGGGHIFERDDIGTAVDEIRRMQGCRFLVSFQPRAGDSSKLRTPRTTVHLLRKGFNLEAPTSFQLPGTAPDRRDDLDALFLLPRFGSGVSAEIGLWPLRPSGKRDRWRGVMLVRVRRDPGVAWPPGVDELVVEAVAHHEGRIYGEYRHVLRGSELQAVRDGAGGKLILFTVDGIRPGGATVAARVSSAASEVAATVRTSFEIPRPPEEGQVRPWFLMDGVARIGDETTFVPALDGVIRGGSRGVILGYGCRGVEPAEPGSGWLVEVGGEETKTVALRWLDPLEGPDRDSRCGWLAGAVDPTIADGLWRFVPPERFADAAEPAVLQFRVETR